MNQFIRSIAALLISMGLMHGICAQVITGKGFLPDENGTNLDDPQASKAVQQKITPRTILKDCSECPELLVIPPGGLLMGSDAQERALAEAAGLPGEYAAWESPSHVVQIRSFAVGRYSVTKGEFAAFVRATGYKTEAERSDGCWKGTGTEWSLEASYNWRNVGFAQRDEHPVLCLSWNDAQAYIQWLNRISGKRYRLPSEAEREYATRGGTQSTFWWGDSITTSQANYAGRRTYNGSPKGEDRQATVPVNSFSSNQFGLYNVHGNVWEWTQDCWHETYLGAPTDGSAWTTGCSGDYRVLRGGSWFDSPANLRSADRGRYSPTGRSNFNGFRLARDL